MSERLSIGEFARRAGLSVSAVRFYGDRGLLVPAAVDPDTGYRTYDEVQVARARLIGELRRLRMSLAGVATFLATPAAEQPVLVGRHLGALEAQLDDARSAAHGLLADEWRSERPVTTLTLPGRDLAAALDQVVPAASRDPERPILGCVLVEARDGSMRLVATDRHRLAVRDLVPEAGDDQPGRGLVPAATLRRWRPFLPGGPVTLTMSAGSLALRADGMAVSCPLVPAEFPAYEPVLARAGEARAIAVGRDPLHAALGRLAEQGDAVLVRAQAGAVTLVRRDEEASVPAHYDGPPADVAVDPRYAAEAVGAVTGPDVVVEIADPLHPVVFRSADDGTFTTLLMPVRLA